MDQRPHNKLSGGKRTAILVTVFLAITVAVLLTLYDSINYKPLRLLALVNLPPILLALPLFLPRSGNPKEGLPKAETAVTVAEEKASKFKRLLAKCKVLIGTVWQKIKVFFAEKHDLIVAVLWLFALVISAWLFFINYRKPLLRVYFDYFVPVILAVLFVVFTILDKWCKHSLPRVAEGEELSGDDRYDTALLQSLRSAASLAKLATLITVVTAVLRLLNVYDLTNVAMILLAVLFVYETVFFLFALVVRFIRKEFSVSPEFAVPVPGLGGSDLGVLTYLEKHTGITMRSLWSMKLVKTVIPYTLIAALVILWGTSGVVMIGEGERGAHYRLGKLAEEPLEPGLHFTLPWPFDSVEVYNTQNVNQMSIGYISDDSTDNLWTETHGSEEYCLLLGGGNELVSVNLRVEYRIGDLCDYLRNSAAPDSILQAMAYESLTARIISTDLDTLLSVDRVGFANAMFEDLRARVAERELGLDVVGVVLESIHPPVEVAEIFQELISAKIDAERYILIAESEAATVRINAYTAKRTLISQATVKKTTMISEANRDVADFLAAAAADAEYSDIFRYEKRRQALIDAYGKATIVLVGDGVNLGPIVTETLD